MGKQKILLIVVIADDLSKQDYVIRFLCIRWNSAHWQTLFLSRLWDIPAPLWGSDLGHLLLEIGLKMNSLSHWPVVVWRTWP